jgi:hypothetical protein
MRGCTGSSYSAMKFAVIQRIPENPMTGNFFQLPSAHHEMRTDRTQMQIFKYSNLAKRIGIRPLASQLQDFLKEREPRHAEKSLLD